MKSSLEQALEKKRQEQRKGQRKHLLDIRPDALQTMEEIKSVHPKYAKHMFQLNNLVKNLAMTEFSNIDVLDLPVCRRCERPALWMNEDARCSCGAITKNPMTVRQYMIQEFRKQLTDEQIEQLGDGIIVT